MVNKLIFTAFIILWWVHASFELNIVPRSEWGARPALDREINADKAKYAIIHHSLTEYCSTPQTCSETLRTIQDFHMDSRGYPDIRDNFAIGGDGRIYEGRGFGVRGGHTPGYNRRSIGIMFIGSYNIAELTQSQINAAKELLLYAVAQGYLKRNYILKAHRQLGAPACPGNNVWYEIKTWPHFQP